VIPVAKGSSGAPKGRDPWAEEEKKPSYSSSYSPSYSPAAPSASGASIRSVGGGGGGGGGGGDKVKEIRDKIASLKESQARKHTDHRDLLIREAEAELDRLLGLGDTTSAYEPEPISPSSAQRYKAQRASRAEPLFDESPAPASSKVSTPPPTSNGGGASGKTKSALIEEIVSLKDSQSRRHNDVRAERLAALEMELATWG